MKCIPTEKQAKMQCTTRVLRAVQKFSVERLIPHTLNHTGDKADAILWLLHASQPSIC